MNRSLFAAAVMLFVFCSTSAYGQGGGDDASSSNPPVDAKAVTIEVTFVKLSAHLKILDPEDIQLDRLQQAIHDANEAGAFHGMTRVRIDTVNQSSASFQSGGRVAVETGRQSFSRGGPSRSVATYREESVGTLIQVTPRIQNPGRVVLQLTIEQSGLAEKAKTPETASGEDEESPDAAPPGGTSTLSIQTTVSVPNGKTVLVSGLQNVNGSPASNEETYVFLKAAIKD